MPKQKHLYLINLLERKGALTQNETNDKYQKESCGRFYWLF